MGSRKVIIVGISGCSSSGKTTLARLLRDIFPNTFVLHQDDFYRPEEQLPIKHGLVDWDCAEALDIPEMERSLAHIREKGTVPPNLDSKEDYNSVGEVPVSDEKVAALKAKVAAWERPGQPGHAVFGGEEKGEGAASRLCVLDGFLLYCEPMATVMTQLDVKLFLLVSRARATQRREARDGYVTLEGFWKDPPGYVDQIVWPNYAEAHAWLFEAGDAEAGVLRRDVLAENGIRAQLDRGLDVDLDTTLEWAVDTLMEALEDQAGKSS